MSSYIPERGDIIWLNFSPQQGHEQAGRRTALVISPQIYNDKVGLALICPTTGQKKGYPFEVEIPGGLEVYGVVLSDHIKSLDWRARKAEYKCKVPNWVVEEVIAKIRPLLEDD